MTRTLFMLVACVSLAQLGGVPTPRASGGGCAGGGAVSQQGDGIAQSGMVNAAVEILKGVNISQIMPWSLAFVLILDKWWSHRREIWRIKSNRDFDAKLMEMLTKVLTKKEGFDEEND